MAWTNSRIFRSYVADSLNRTEPFDLNADTLMAALFDNSITPDQNAASASTAYNAGQWVTAGEVSQSGQWDAGGIALTGVSVDVGTAGVVFLDAVDTASGAAFTGSGIYGTLVYDTTVASPVADQGVTFNYFGGTQSVTAGTLTIVWHTDGIMRFTLTP
jgi:hypothetical protein